jgi:hypothetical protein
MLDLDVTPQEGMIFHFAGQASGESRVFDIWDLQGAFDQFLRQAARLIVKDPHFLQPRKNSNNLSDPESIAGSWPSLPAQRDQLAQWLPSGSPLARRMHRNTRTALPQYYEMKILSDPPDKRSAEDVSSDYLEPEERTSLQRFG